MKTGVPVQIYNDEKQPYYLLIKGEAEGMERFSIVQADWFIPVKDEDAKVLPEITYFAPYISFDPYYKHLYTYDGVRIEKNGWSLYVGEYNDLESALDKCDMMKSRNIEETYIMIDQYGGNINFQVYIGNFSSKSLAVKYATQVSPKGIRTQLRDIKNY